jgi:hypothetical protein
MGETSLHQARISAGSAMLLLVGKGMCPRYTLFTAFMWTTLELNFPLLKACILPLGLWYNPEKIIPHSFVDRVVII